MKATHYIVIFSFSIFLAVLGFFFYFDLINLSIRQFTNVSFGVPGTGSTEAPLTFALSFLSISVMFILVNWVSQIRNVSQIFLFYLLTMVFGVLFWYFRLEYFKGLTEDILQQGIPSSKLHVAVSHVQLEIFCWLGFGVGALISLIWLRITNKKFRKMRIQENNLLDNFES